MCPVVKGNCIKGECLAFQTQRIRSAEEIKSYLGADIPIERIIKGNIVSIIK